MRHIIQKERPIPSYKTAPECTRALFIPHRLVFLGFSAISSALQTNKPWSIRTVAVTLHLARYGKKAVPFYRIVVSEKGSKRDGRFIERVGTYNPLTDPATIIVKEDRVRKWVDEGAQMTVQVRSIIKKSIPGFIEEIEKRRLEKKRTARQKRKARAKSPKKAKK